LLFEILKDLKTEREIRVSVIDALTETFAMTKNLFTKYFEPMMSEYLIIAQWSTKIEDKLDYELLDF
jgi:hypothetical protein